MTLSLASAITEPFTASFGLGRYQAAEQDWQAKPRNFPAANRGVLYCHGAGQDATSMSDATKTGQVPLIRGIASQYPTIAPDLGGAFTWGNSTCQTRAETARGYLGTGMGAVNAKIHLVGISMGGLTALQYAKANPTKVASISLILPTVDLDYDFQNDAQSSRASIGTAWGVTFPTPLPAGAKILADASYGLPMKIWYVTNDPYTLTASSTTFAANQSASAVSLGTLGHTETAFAAVPIADVIAFMAANN